MKITIRYHAQARQAAGRGFETIEAAQSISIHRLMLDLASRHGEPLRGMLLTETGRPHPSLLLFVSDEQMRGDSAAVLADGAEVVVLSPIAGG